MRSLINRFGIPIAAILMVLALVVIYRVTRNKPAAGVGARVYFYDTESQEVLVLPVSSVPPMVGKSGKPTVVRAVFLSCDGGKSKQLAYLVKYTDEAKAARDRAARGETIEHTQSSEEMLIRLPKPDSPWISISSTEGLEIVNLSPCDGGVEPVPVNP